MDIASSSADVKHRRGEVNIVFVGLPAFHPNAVEQGFDPEKVDQGIRADVTAVMEAGYNFYVLAAGPEIPMAVLSEKLRSKRLKWHAFGIGLGVRASENDVVIRFFEDLVDLFHDEAPDARAIFNKGPRSTLAALKHRFPLTNPDEQSARGRLIGWDELFDGKKNPPLQDLSSSDHARGDAAMSQKE